jgi:hypothetical protein
LRVILTDCGELKSPRKEDHYLTEDYIGELLFVYDNEDDIQAGDAGIVDIDQKRPTLRKMQRVSMVTQCQRVFWTEYGKLGLAPRHCEKGDKICILHGSKTPYVLRERNGIYYAMGQCYLEGVMFGEAVTWKEDEADVLKLM